MNKLMRLFSYALITAVLFSACDSDDDNKFSVNEEIEGCYILNYGSFGKGGGSITRYNYSNDSLTLNYFQKQNGQQLASNIQYGALYKENIYLMGNEADGIITLDKFFKPEINAAHKDIAKPRFFVGDDKYLYISCLGENPDWAEMPNTYIAKFNTERNSVEETIELPGGPEGLAIANGKLYAALNYDTKVAVIDLEDHSISYIETPAATSYFIKDENDNLYVTLISTYTNPSDKAGLGYINTVTDELENNYVLDGVSSSYASIMSASSKNEIIYLTAASWVEESTDNWVQKGAIFAFDTESNEFSEFAGNLTGANGVAVNPINDDVYVLLSASPTEAGSVSIYNSNGDYQKNIAVGISPYWAIFLN